MPKLPWKACTRPMLLLGHDQAGRRPVALAVAATTGPGRNGARCAFTATGPAPGPPPPCGRGEGLVQVDVHHVEAEVAGPDWPTIAFRLAPSLYTWPPAAWTRSADLQRCSARTGRACWGWSASCRAVRSSRLALSCSRSTLPSASDLSVIDLEAGQRCAWPGWCRGPSRAPAPCRGPSSPLRSR